MKLTAVGIRLSLGEREKSEMNKKDKEPKTVFFGQHFWLHINFFLGAETTMRKQTSWVHVFQQKYLKSGFFLLKTK